MMMVENEAKEAKVSEQQAREESGVNLRLAFLLLGRSLQNKRLQDRY